MSWTLIEHQALTSSVASVTLGSGGTIPQTYKSLKVLCSVRNDSSNDLMLISFNGNTSNFQARWVYGDGIGASSGNSNTTFARLVAWVENSGFTANTFGNAEISVPNYASTTANKPISADSVQENNSTVSVQAMVSTLWSNTAAITSIGLAPTSGNFVSGSTFTLYGLA